MAETISYYNQASRLFLGQEIDLTQLKVMLLSDDAEFDATDTDLDDVAGAAGPSRANEVHGNGWTEGGELIENVVVTTVDTNDAKLDADPVVKTATGGSIGPAYKAVIFDDSHADKAVVAFIDFDAASVGGKTAGIGTDFRIDWNANGIFKVTNAA